MDFDLDDPQVLMREDVLEDPGPFYDTLRREAPVWRIPGQDTFLVSDPALVREAVRRKDDFSSNLVSLLCADESGCPAVFAMAPFGDPIHVLATADPPVHTLHRKILQAHLGPAATAELEPVVTRVVREHLGPMLESGSADFVARFGDPVPAEVICNVVGIPPEDAPQIASSVSAVGALLDGVTPAEGMGPAAEAAMVLSSYVQGHLEDAMIRPEGKRSGLLAVFADSIESGTVAPDEARDMLLVLVTAGSETTSALMATAVETLARDHELQERLRCEPRHIPGAIEDFLRTNGPFQFHYRATHRVAMLGGMCLPANSRVLLMWAAANRPSPQGSDHVPDMSGDRIPVPHFAFGKGLHFCIGASIARLEVRVALELLLARTTSIELDPDRAVTRRPSIFLRRHAGLPIVLTRR
jgi:cytochrome P450